MSPARKTIAVLIDHVDRPTGGYESRLRHAFDSAARKLDWNLLFVVGRCLEDPDPSQLAHNSVYRLMHPDCVDGIILMAGGLCTHSGPDGLVRLCRELPNLPLCSIGVALPGVPSVLHDSRPAMATLVDHIVREHGCRRLAFLGGPPQSPDARARFDVFREVVERNCLGFDRELVRHCPFTAEAGKAAVRELLSSAANFDAVIAGNDCLAQGALEALRAHGLRVPRDVLVTGFDDLALAKLANPPLTTVRQPLERMAELAVELIAAQVAGCPVPPRVDLPGQMVTRKSCGCDLRTMPRPSLFPSTGEVRAATFLENHGSRLTRLVAAALGLSEATSRVWAERLVQALRDELEGQTEIFLTTVEQLLEEVGATFESYDDCQTALSQLWIELWPFATFELEALWHEARRVIGLANNRVQAQKRWDLEDAFVRLLRIGDRLTAATDLASLQRLLVEEIPVLGLTRAFVALHPSDSQSEFVPFFALDAGVPVIPPSDASPTMSLCREVTATEERHSAFVMPLTNESQQIGVALFEFGSLATIYDMLREQISIALKNVTLHAELVKRTALHERSVQERAATAERMKSLSVLAGGVAHDLNNALGPLLALPDLIRQELETETTKVHGPSQEVLTDLVTIQSASLRASQTIKDLLTLGRQGHARKEPVDLNGAVTYTYSSDRARLEKFESGRILLTLDLENEPLVIRGSESHLSRAFSNLVRNAAESIDGPGEVRLRTSRVSIREPQTGYEVIEPGEYAVVCVEDTGKGIADMDLRRIFEPFFSQKRLSGSSGSGLGLAIVHGVVKEHGGFIDVQSHPGIGTTFTLYFPQIDEPVDTRQPAAVGATGNARILVVDDDPVQLRTASRVLGRFGYSVETLDSGVKAIHRFESAASEHPDCSPYDLVVMDMVLREQKSGVEVLQIIRSHFAAQKALVVSGFAPKDEATPTYPEYEWLVKPYTAEALVRAVEIALGRAPATTRRDPAMRDLSP